MGSGDHKGVKMRKIFDGMDIAIDHIAYFCQWYCEWFAWALCDDWPFSAVNGFISNLKNCTGR